MAVGTLNANVSIRDCVKGYGEPLKVYEQRRVSKGCFRKALWRQAKRRVQEKEEPGGGSSVRSLWEESRRAAC